MLILSSRRGSSQRSRLWISHLTAVCLQSQQTDTSSKILQIMHHFKCCSQMTLKKKTFLQASALNSKVFPKAPSPTKAAQTLPQPDALVSSQLVFELVCQTLKPIQVPSHHCPGSRALFYATRFHIPPICCFFFLPPQHRSRKVQANAGTGSEVQKSLCFSCLPVGPPCPVTHKAELFSSAGCGRSDWTGAKRANAWCRWPRELPEEAWEPSKHTSRVLIVLLEANVKNIRKNVWYVNITWRQTQREKERLWQLKHYRLNKVYGAVSAAEQLRHSRGNVPRIPQSQFKLSMLYLHSK